MLSTEYRLSLNSFCNKIVNGEEVKLEDMIWANKLAKANRSAGEMLRKARRTAMNPDIQEGSLDDFMNKMDIGDPNHKTDPSSGLVSSEPTIGGKGTDFQVQTR